MIADMANESVQDTEVAGLKSSFDGHVNDIKGIGDFTHVLSLRPTKIDIVCKFQISGKLNAKPHIPQTESDLNIAAR